MLKHFLLTLYRQMLRKPGFYLLNLIGLSVGVAAFLFMFEYARYELSFDRFHQDADDLYRVDFHYTPFGRPPYTGAAVFSGVAPAMKSEFPAVEVATRLVSIWGGGGIVRYGEKKVKAEEVQYAESALFDIFSFEIIDGNAHTALDDVHTVMLSQTMHDKLFGKESGVGKTLEIRTMDGMQNYMVTGIYSVPDNSHYHADLLLSFSSHAQRLDQDPDTQWRWFDYITYVKLRPGTDPDQIETQFPAMIDKNVATENRNSKTMAFKLMPVTDIHLHSHINQEIRANGDYQTVSFLLVIAVLVLTIAWINYINLYTAQATERGKEVGIRKTLGVSKRKLALQFMSEAFLMNLMAMLLALVLVKLCRPALASHIGIILPENLLFESGFWLRLVGIWALGSLVSGVYPALLISNFDPLKALKSVSMKSSGKLRRVLVVWQFMASAALVIGAVTVYNQLHQMNQQPTGMDTEDIVVFNAPQFRGDAQAYYQSLNQFKNHLLEFPGVMGASFSSDVPGKVVGWRGGSRLLGETEAQGGMIYKMVIGQDYLGLYNIQLLAGRNFETTTDSLSVILNETALELYAFDSAEEALGKRIFFTGVDTLRVVGVVKDHYQESLKEAVKPTAFLQMEEELMYLFVRYQGENMTGFIDYAEPGFAEAFPELAFEWRNLEAQMTDRHASEQHFLKAFNLFVLLSVIISALGLVGLAAYLARKRQKEMGLRKVLGASGYRVLLHFLKDFFRLALIGNLIVLPFAFYYANQWLDQFAFRTNFLWWLPLVTVLFSLLLAILATLRQVLKVAYVNPANVLSHE